MQRFSVIYALLGALLWFVLTPVANAQTATVGGRIVDQTKWIVSGAQITVLNPETNAIRVDITDETGLLRFASLVPSLYRLAINKSGFKTLHIDDLVLTVNQVFTFEAHLAVGTITTTTEVKASELPSFCSSNLKMPRSAT
jgi:hypothetical protein